MTPESGYRFSVQFMRQAKAAGGGVLPGWGGF
jgi:hypothetical protein